MIPGLWPSIFAVVFSLLYFSFSLSTAQVIGDSLLIDEAHRLAYTSDFKDKKPKRSHNIVKSRFLLLLLLVGGTGSYGMVCWFL